MATSPRMTRLRRWLMLPASLAVALIGAVLINNTDHLDELGIGLVTLSVFVAFVSTPPTRDANKPQ